MGIYDKIQEDNPNNGNPTLVFGIVAGIGCNKDIVIRSLRKNLKMYNYDVSIIKISNYILNENNEVVGNSKEIMEEKIRLGNLMCEKNKDKAYFSTKVANLINESKCKYLEEYCGVEKDKLAILADLFINLNDCLTYEKTFEYFQNKNIDDCIRDNLGKIDAHISRFIQLIFGNPYLSPTFDEYAMFIAQSTAIRSTDLSRQIGAVITRDDEILSYGNNDCPKYGGGLYSPEMTRQSDGEF